MFAFTSSVCAPWPYEIELAMSEMSNAPLRRGAGRLADLLGEAEAEREIAESEWVRSQNLRVASERYGAVRPNERAGSARRMQIRH